MITKNRIRVSALFDGYSMDSSRLGSWLLNSSFDWQIQRSVVGFSDDPALGPWAAPAWGPCTRAASQNPSTDR